MKFVKVITFVLSFHVGLIVLLVIQPGCNTISEFREAASAQTITTYDQYAVSDVDIPSEFNGGFDVTDEAFEVEQPVVMEVAVAKAEELRQVPMRPTWNLVTEETMESQELTETKLLEPLVIGEEEMNGDSYLAEYTVVKGDSLWVLAKREGVDFNELLDLNGLNRRSTLTVGQKLRIPENKEEGLASEILAANTEGGEYKIKSGDSLSVIAKRFGVSVESIRKANKMTSDKIYAGKRIVIPGVDEAAIQSTVAKTGTPNSRVVNSGNADSYEVKSGESLSVIAKKHGVTVADLMTLNAIEDAKKLRTGQVIKIGQPLNPSNESGEHLFSSNKEVQDPIEFDSMSLFEDDGLFNQTEEIPVVPISSRKSG